MKERQAPIRGGADRVARLRRRRRAARPLRRAGGHHPCLTGTSRGTSSSFGPGFLLLFVGQVLIVTGLRDALGRAWVLPLVGAAGHLGKLAYRPFREHSGRPIPRRLGTLVTRWRPGRIAAS